MRDRRKRLGYDALTLCLVPGLTVCLASLDNWFNSNLSLVGNGAGGRLAFAAWGIAAGAYYICYALYLFRLGGYRGAAGRILAFAAGGFLVTAVFIPYLPEAEPQAAALHVLLAFFSPILFGLSLAVFLAYLSRGGGRFGRAWAFMGLLAGGALILLWEAGFITSFLEIFLVAGLCVFLRYMEGALKREEAGSGGAGFHPFP